MTVYSDSVRQQDQLRESKPELVTDCLLVGHNEMDFRDYYGILENMAASSGRDHVAFRDLQFNCVNYQGDNLQGQDMLTVLYNEGRPEADRQVFYNGDCFWTALAYLGSYLHKRNYSFDYVNLFQFEKEKLRQLLLDNDYRAVVLTGTMYVFEQNIWEVVQFIRSIRKDVKIIAGGPYISKQAEEREPEYLRPLFKYLNADFYCYSREGEQTLIRLIDALREGTAFDSIPNLAYREGRSFKVTPKVIEHTPLIENVVDYDLFATDYAKSGWANIRISDGCPYACGFCSFPEHGNERYVTLPLDRIEQELDAIKVAGAITHIFFVDATFNVPKKKFKALMRLMIRKQYGFKWHCFFRCDQADEEAITLMKEAGCMGVFLGLESASDIVLSNMDKTAHKEDFRRTMPIFKRLGLLTMVSVQVGFPGETYETFDETLEFLEEIKPDFTRIQIWFCDVTTPVWYKRKMCDLQGKGYGWRHYTMDAETAVGLVEDAFMRLEGVTWIPDPGYNWVFCYMLESLGMSIERQKAFLDAFAAAAKERLVLPGRKAIRDDILGEMRALAQFDRPARAPSSVIQLFTGAVYKMSEAFWVSQSASSQSDDLTTTPPQKTVYTISAAASPITLSRFELGDLARNRSQIEAAALAAIAELDGGTESVAFSPDNDVPFPIPANSVATTTDRLIFAESQRDQFLAHRTFGFFIQQSAQKMAFWRRKIPSLCYGLVGGVDIQDIESITERFTRIPKVFDRLKMIFSIEISAREFRLGMIYDPSTIGAENAQQSLTNVTQHITRLLVAQADVFAE